MDYLKFDRLSLKTSTEFNEHWVQERIAEDPGILGLGDVILKDKERVQPRAGRLDLLLQDADGTQRYEVEVQLGAQMKATLSAPSNTGTSNENGIPSMSMWPSLSRKTSPADFSTS